jgi:hypothetical protein
MSQKLKVITSQARGKVENILPKHLQVENILLPFGRIKGNTNQKHHEKPKHNFSSNRKLRS